VQRQLGEVLGIVSDLANPMGEQPASEQPENE
jgi:hypothetical protein